MTSIAPCENRVLEKSSNTFFANIHGVRAIAAFIVVYIHIEQYRAIFGLTNHVKNPVMEQLASFWVIFYFVLSGFMVAHVSLTEQRTYGYLNIRKLFVKRFFRIYPLYILIVVLSLFVFPHLSWLYVDKWTPAVADNLLNKLLLFAAILPNVVGKLYPPVPFASQTWFIAEVEQFYFLWPLLMKISKRPILTALGVVAFFALMPHAVWFLASPKHHILPSSSFLDFTKHYLANSHLKALAIGAFFAVAFSNFRVWFTRIITKKITQVLLFGTLLLLSFGLLRMERTSMELYSMVFGFGMILLASSTRTILKLEGPIVEYLGRISYSIYIVHCIAVVLAIKAANVLVTNQNGALHFVTSIVLALAGTLALAAMAYSGIEKPLLQIRKRFR